MLFREVGICGVSTKFISVDFLVNVVDSLTGSALHAASSGLIM